MRLISGFSDCAARRFTRTWATWIAEYLVEVSGRSSVR